MWAKCQLKIVNWGAIWVSELRSQFNDNSQTELQRGFLSGYVSTGGASDEILAINGLVCATITLNCTCLLIPSAIQRLEITGFWEPSELPRQQHPKFGCRHEARDRKATKNEKKVCQTIRQWTTWLARVFGQKQHWFSRAPQARGEKCAILGAQPENFWHLGELPNFTFLTTNAELTEKIFPWW